MEELWDYMRLVRGLGRASICLQMTPPTTNEKKSWSTSFSTYSIFFKSRRKLNNCCALSFPNLSLDFKFPPRYHKRICFVGITLTGNIFKLPLCQRMSIVEDKMTPFIERRPQIGKMFPRKINHQFWSLLKFAHLLQNTQEHY